MLKISSKMYPWLVIGISGVTCGGKTSLTFRLRDLLNQYFFSRKQPVNVLTISQDDFFLKPDDPRHIFLPSLGHINWELPTAVDLNKMHQKVLGIISGEENAEIEKKSEVEMEAVSVSSKLGLKGILLIEGFLCLNHEPTRTLCHLGYYIVLSRSTCEKRRSFRTYDPPDIPGYFEQVVWPEHVYRRSEVIGKGVLVDRSDPLSMNEVQQALDEENIKEKGKVVIEVSKDNPSYLPTQGKQSAEKFQNSDFTTTADECNYSSKMLIVDVIGNNEKDNLWMRRGRGVVELKGDFGDCGLAVVNGIRVLNGGVISKEDMAQKVFQDILREIKSFE